jgi:hypothetical protein
MLSLFDSLVRLMPGLKIRKPSLILSLSGVSDGDFAPQFEIQVLGRRHSS